MSAGLVFRESNHSYRLDGKPVPGVTTLLGKGLPKPALPRWAAKSAAEYVADNLEVLNALPDRESIIATVKQSPWTQRDRAAVRGTDVHDLAEHLLHGREVEVPEHLAPYVDGYVRFLDLWQPQVILTPACGSSTSPGSAARAGPSVASPRTTTTPSRC